MKGNVNADSSKPLNKMVSFADSSDLNKPQLVEQLDQQLLMQSGMDCLVEPHKTSEVASSTSGVVKFINVDRGDTIESGQVLAKLEYEVQQAGVQLANARVKFTAKKLVRMRELFKKKMVPSQELDEAITESDLAIAEHRKEEELLKQRIVKSPLSGVVVERYLSPGEYVENKPILKIAQIDPLNIELIAPVTMLGEFKNDAKVVIYPEGPIKGPLEARVTRIDRVVDASSGTFRVRLELPNPDLKISAGVSCRAMLVKSGSE
ncbi:MAG: efflux RND transporter periplasmic adaptor subunit [Gammaproteobacteria bacterium]|nr:efflux RND transporter periplasmic adaptor subunit [Gammaproteobacteria bacterium]